MLRYLRYYKLIVVCVFFVCLSCAVNPVTNEREFLLMGEEQELRLGKKLYPKYTQLSYGLFQDPALQSYVQTVGMKLARVSDRPHLAYEFNVVNDSRVNAYALPGGKISITRGMLTKMGNEAQLAAVLSHEIGHVAAKHAAQGYTRNVLAGVLTNIAGIALQSSSVSGSDFLLRSGQMLTQMVLMKYSRDQERQADQLGMEYMVRSGYNPEGMIELTKILKSLNKRHPGLVEVMFSTHPPSQERFQSAIEQVQSYPAKYHSQERLYKQSFQQKTASIRHTQPAYAKMDEALEMVRSEDRKTKGLELLVQASKEAPNQALIWMMRAAMENELDLKQRAYQSVQKSVDLYPGLFFAQYLAGKIAFEVSEYNSSLDHLDQADGIISDVPAVIFYKGRNFEAIGQRDSAAQAYIWVLKKVQQGQMARYCYIRLKRWGYI